MEFEQIGLGAKETSIQTSLAKANADITKLLNEIVSSILTMIFNYFISILVN